MRNLSQAPNLAEVSSLNLTPKQDRFCAVYLETGNASEAYRQAYNAENMKPETIHRKAAELLKDGKITARIEALKQPIIDKAQYTLEEHLARLEHLSKAAEQAGKFSAAINAEIARGKASGFYIHRAQIEMESIEQALIDLSDLSDEELYKLAEAQDTISTYLGGEYA